MKRELLEKITVYVMIISAVFTFGIPIKHGLLTDVTLLNEIPTITHIIWYISFFLLVVSVLVMSVLTLKEDRN